MRDAIVRRPSRVQRRTRLLGLLCLVHPFPSLLNAVVVGVLACVAVRGWPGIGPLLRLTGTMLTIQCAIGVMNDWADRDLDAREKPWKPIPAGLVPARLALGVALLLIGIAVVLAAAAPRGAWLLAISGLAIGLAYDLGLKRTPISALTYALALPLVPLWVWSALGRATPALSGVLPVGVLLGFALQLANALPDAAGDEAGGIRGTLQWLGPDRGRSVAWAAFVAALVLALALAVTLRLRPAPFGACWLIAVLLLGTAVVLYRREPSVRSLQRGWSLLAPAAGVLAVGWLASLP